MKIVQYLGGLGNQMFQHAFYLALKKRFSSVKADLSQFKGYEIHNGYELNEVFGIDVEEASKFERGLYYNPGNSFLLRKLRSLSGLKNSVFYERSEFIYDDTIFNNRASRYFIGYWQNEEYFQWFSEEIRNEFSFKKPLCGKNLDYLNLIKSSNSVSIHIRRGDYVNHPLHGGICDINYYLLAIKKINGRITDPLFFIFSDDIDWCKTNISLEKAIFITNNEGVNSAIDMQLMSLCKHQVIANSSFSWWAAWLNQQSDKIVIAPLRWINKEFKAPITIIPQDWIKI